MHAKRLLLAAAALAGLGPVGNVGLSQTCTHTSLPTRSWLAAASSADGTKLAVAGAGYIYTSTNSGLVWTQSTAPPVSWPSIACSADGRIQGAGAFGGTIYFSTNSGLTWAPASAPVTNWSSIAASADGSKWVAACAGDGLDTALNGPIYTSTNYGGTWTQTTAPIAHWVCVASSADGRRLAATWSGLYQFPTPGAIFLSSDSGVTWTQASAPSAGWCSIACSADGTRLVATAWFPDALWTSCDAGLTWTQRSGPAGRVAASANGMKLIAAGAYNSECTLYTSADGGTTWAQASAPYAFWFGVATSADGCKLLAVIQGGQVYTCQTTPAPVLSISPCNSSVALAWTVPSANFLLQQQSGLNHTNWVPVTNVPTLVSTNLQMQVVLPRQDASAFFRLSAR